MGSRQGERYRLALEGALADRMWRVRASAAEGLKRLADPAALTALEARADDPHRVVRSAIDSAIASLKTIA